MKAVEPIHWELLDESGMSVIKKIVEDGYQGPTNEQGPFGWYSHPTTLDINKASMGKKCICCRLFLFELSEDDDFFRK